LCEATFTGTPGASYVVALGGAASISQTGTFPASGTDTLAGNLGAGNYGIAVVSGGQSASVGFTVGV
jgi:hypothetical protein